MALEQMESRNVPSDVGVDDLAAFLLGTPLNAFVGRLAGLGGCLPVTHRSAPDDEWADHGEVKNTSDGLFEV